MSAWGDSWGACTSTSSGSSSCGGDIVCGTGNWKGPKPGDPDNNISIHARGLPGIVEVSWNYPVINPHAVSHLKLYRGISSEFGDAVEKAIVSGNIYIDIIPEDEIKMYFYWIQMVSNNGTTMDPVGPASATPGSLQESTLGQISGEIDAGYLAQSLRERIDLISAIERNIAEETLARIHANQALADALAAVQSESDEARTYILNEITERRDADSALVKSIEVIAAGIAENAAAIVEEREVRVTAEEATASAIDILYSNVESAEAAILQERNTRVSENEAIASELEALAVINGGINSAIETERTARITQDAAIVSQVNSWAAKTNATAAGLESEVAARASSDAALASQIATAQTVLNGNIASVQTNMQSQITSVDGKVASIGALWTAKVDVNGLVGGFGVYNNGQFVDAGFDVDRFWVGRSVNKTRPFLIEGGTVYMNSAVIKDLSVDTIKIKNGAITVGAAGSWNSNSEQSLWITFSQACKVSCIITTPGVQWDSGGEGSPGLVIASPIGFYFNGSLVKTTQSPTTVVADIPAGTHRFSLKPQIGSTLQFELSVFGFYK
jgi:hypothetical protein